MRYVYIGKKPTIIWGKILRNEKPQLPPGYRYIERPREWLLAEAPCGRRYYVSSDGSGFLLRQVVTPYGNFGCDDNQLIVLPQKQLT
jgi:hypothetical protein